MIPGHVSDAITDFSDEVRAKYRGRKRGADGHFVTANDRERARVLLDISKMRCVSFHAWSVHDLFIFSVRTYPEDLLARTVQRRESSSFLRTLHGLWNPSMGEWICLLRRVCVLGSFRLFVMVLRLNHCQRAGDMHALAQAIVYDLPLLTMRDILPAHYPPPTEEEVRELPGHPAPEPFADDVMEAVCASFVNRPHDIAWSRRHVTCILELAGSLGPRGIGIMCRRLLMYLTRPMQCRCDAEGPKGGGARRAQCECRRSFDLDNRREYARVLFFTLFERMEDWDVPEKREFLMEACAQRFSVRVYEELSRCLVGPGDVPKNPRVRPYTELELKECYHMDHSVVMHAGCAAVRLSAASVTSRLALSLPAS
jgi:hypothetical protein